jgi:MFS family permease
MEETIARPHQGMRVFTIMWIGQLVSIVGSGLTGFALGVWVYRNTGSVMEFAFVALFGMLPKVLIAPLAGAIVDRWDRRTVMLLSDVGAACSSLALAGLLLSGQIQVWHIYLATAISAIMGVFQQPAFDSSVPLLVPRQHLGRANGLIQAGWAVGQIVSPVLAGALVETIRIGGVLLIDVATFVFAVGTLLFVRVPRPPQTDEGAKAKGSLLRESAFGMTYLLARPGLLGLLILFAIANLTMATVGVLVTPLVLSVASAGVLGSVLATGGIGTLVGGVAMSIWGGPKRRVLGVIGFLLLGSAAIVVGGLRPSVPLLFVAAFGFFFTVPVISGNTRVLWQTKVAPDVLGRVLAMSNMIATATTPLAYLVAGPLADHVFEPMLAAGGQLAGSVGLVIGVGPGRGIGLMFVLAGVLLALATIGGYLYPRIRLLEDELPDVLTDETPES